MKIIKYDDRGKVIGSEHAHIPEIEGGVKKQDIPELNVVDSMTRKKTLRAAIVGVILGIPIGFGIEVLRLLIGNPWEGPFWGIIGFVCTLLISMAVGYIHGSMTDRE